MKEKICLNEKMHIFKLDNGLDATIIPIKNASRKYTSKKRKHIKASL